MLEQGRELSVANIFGEDVAGSGGAMVITREDGDDAVDLAGGPYPIL